MRRDGLKGGLFLIALGAIVFAASTVPPGSLGGLVAGPFLALLGMSWIVLAIRDHIKEKRAEDDYWQGR